MSYKIDIDVGGNLGCCQGHTPDSILRSDRVGMVIGV